MALHFRTHLRRQPTVYCAIFLWCCARISSAADAEADADVVAETTTPRVRLDRGLEEQILIRQLLSNGSKYDWRIRPLGENDSESNGGPVNVLVNIYLRTISKVDDVNMEYSLHFTFREEWCDNRLKFNSPLLSYILLTPQQQIWMPDTFFQNEKEGRSHMIDKPNVLLRIQNGTGCILYSVRLTLMLSCPMHLANYPLDSQECFCDLASYAYTTADIVYKWKDFKPIQIKDGLRSSLPSFTLSNVQTGNYSCLRLVLILKREFSYYLLQLYIPSFMLVAVSWVSFWLDKDSVPARVTLGVTTLLTMSTQAAGINSKLPPVSYTKAIDVWIGVCLAFIFGALLEFALVNYAARRDMLDDIHRRRKIERGEYGQQHLINCRNNHAFDPTAIIEFGSPYLGAQYANHTSNSCRQLQNNIKVISGSHRHHRSLMSNVWRVKYKERSKRIDVLSRVIFPLTFAIFNIIYWANYLTPYLQVVTDDTVGG